jgi:hypothetical protein
MAKGKNADESLTRDQRPPSVAGVVQHGPACLQIHLHDAQADSFAEISDARLQGGLGLPPGIDDSCEGVRSLIGTDQCDRVVYTPESAVVGRMPAEGVIQTVGHLAMQTGFGVASTDQILQFAQIRIVHGFVRVQAHRMASFHRFV